MDRIRMKPSRRANPKSGFKTYIASSGAYLNLLLSFIPPPSGGLNQNQQNVANAIVGFFNANGGIPLVFGGSTPAGLTQASGEVATASSLGLGVDQLAPYLLNWIDRNRRWGSPFRTPGFRICRGPRAKSQ